MFEILQNIAYTFVRPFTIFLNPNNSLYFGYLLLFIPLGLIAGYWHHPEFRQQKWQGVAVFCRRIQQSLGSRSFFLDVKFVYVNFFVRSIIFFALAVNPLVVAVLVRSLLQKQSLVPEGLLGYSPAVCALLLFLQFMAVDFGFFIAHYAEHKIPILWEFHKVHHTSDVLTPISQQRFHPVDTLIDTVCVALVAGTFAGIAGHLVADVDVALPFAGITPLSAVLYGLTAPLRHSNIWFHYGRHLNKVLASPAYHQIHHSIDRDHHDKNLARIFSVWDLAFGSFYNPGTKQTLRFGVSDEDQQLYNRSVASLYLQPCKNVWNKHLNRITLTVRPKRSQDGSAALTERTHRT